MAKNDEIPEVIRNAFADETDPERAAELAAELASEAAEAASKPKPSNKNAQQADMADIVIEDPQLEEYLRDVYDNAEAHAKYTAGAKGIKTRMLEEHGNAVNSDDDGVHTGYVRCGEFRFMPRYSSREAVTREVTYGAGKDWQPLEISKI